MAIVSHQLAGELLERGASVEARQVVGHLGMAAGELPIGQYILLLLFQVQGRQGLRRGR